ncbi:MAG: hypothetical protein ABI378_09645 [Chitinophagaceae bacterium]
MTATQSLRLYELTLEFVKDQAKAKEYVSKIEEAVDDKFIQREGGLASKLEIESLKTNLAEVKSDLIKWMFIFWIGSVLATLGGLVVIVRFMIVR